MGQKLRNLQPKENKQILILTWGRINLSFTRSGLVFDQQMKCNLLISQTLKMETNTCFWSIHRAHDFAMRSALETRGLKTIRP